MLDSKLVEAIKSLNQAELSGFASFLDSRFFQREFSVAQLKQLFFILQEAIGTPDPSWLSKEVVHEQVFESKSFAENRVDRIMFELNRLLKQFLLIKHYLREENEVQKSLDWATIQRSKELSNNQDKQLEKLRREIESQDKTAAEKYYDYFKVALEEHVGQAKYNRGKGDIGLQNTIEALDFYYYVQRLELLTLLTIQQRMTSIAPSQLAVLTFDKFVVPPYYLENNKALFLTNEVFQLLKIPQPDTAGFQKLIDLLKRHEDALAPVVLQQFYSYLRNYCVILIDNGLVEFNNVLHELQKDNLKRGYFYSENKISPNALLNIIQHAIRANNVEWAWELISSHKDKIIGENESRDFYHMCEALCLFAEKKYDEALKVIPFGSTYSAYHVMARRLELKIYYETKSEVLPSKIDAFKMYINRSGNKIFSKSMTELYTNFGNIVHQLSLSIPGDKKRSEQLLRRIQEKKHVSERSWLMEKAQELGTAKM